ncbi:flagellar hook-basal body complex protein FliE [Pseudemcibacter aquimaris]|uniref:flagellar hook-basal body complex protein FliE n=1 Tax=Pseudemcibacter aquimaris TaxID=2857064 RepID=UPI0020127180|nr:flagellar hook-basal body complex protein FliE [Pseudemcibacter aquimaris]MCC3860827.1 flagellar hook-basal body complex protein FliE [Pseudemcibacter aquimaris]WDU59646.1 flagellar hook-basal body complex protein FliE [Pseudemcibacter aquimaris]
MADLKAMDAANAYANVIKNQGDGSVGSVGSIGSLDGNGQGASTFSDMLSETISSTAGAVNESANAGINAMSGQAELVDVVTTVQNTEMVLETVVAVRDKVISAYNDIIKMPI